METLVFYNELTKVLDKQKIFLNENMSKHTSFKIGGNADYYIKAENVTDIKNIIRLSKNYNIHLKVIGNGSNILVRDKGFRGILLKLEIKNIELTNVDENTKDLIVASGVPLIQLSQFAYKNCLTGLEFACGIPGTVGGAIKMNAGAYGKEMKDIIKETTYIDSNGTINKIKTEEHKFEYRKSLFSELKDAIILETILTLNVGHKEEILKQMEENNKSRKEKQPITMPSAGSTFKRGKDFITAKLIDECGLKGYSIGDAMVSPMHAGFIVNKGNATAQDVTKLIEYVQKEVYNKFKKDIELEIEIIGEK